MLTLADPNIDKPISWVVAEEISKHEIFPQELETVNVSVKSLLHLAPGVLYLESQRKSDEILLVSVGIHSNERAGIYIADQLLKEIFSNQLEVRTNVVFVYGSLKSMYTNHGLGDRALEADKPSGRSANLNRNFGKSFINSGKTYAEDRADEIKTALQTVLPGKKVMGIDIHQSLKCPTVSQVRNNSNILNQYVYVMLYPRNNVDFKPLIKWVNDDFSDVLSGVVLNKKSNSHSTFASYLVREFDALGGTFEMGRIGTIDYTSFTPYLLNNLRLKIQKQDQQVQTQPIDIWSYQGSIIRETKAFSFLDNCGSERNPAEIFDFMPIDYTLIAKDRGKEYKIRKCDRLLFANDKVPIGDRAAAVVAPQNLSFEEDQNKLCI